MYWFTADLPYGDGRPGGQPHPAVRPDRSLRCEVAGVDEAVRDQLPAAALGHLVDEHGRAARRLALPGGAVAGQLAVQEAVHVLHRLQRGEDVRSCRVAFQVLLHGATEVDSSGEGEPGEAVDLVLVARARHLV